MAVEFDHHGLPTTLRLTATGRTPADNFLGANNLFTYLLTFYLFTL